MGGTTAPVTASGSCPTWRALVANACFRSLVIDGYHIPRAVGVNQEASAPRSWRKVRLQAR